MGGDVIKMLGGGELGGKLAGQINVGSFQQLHKAVQLTGGDEGIDRVGKQQDIRLFYGSQSGGEVLLQSLDGLASVEDFKVMLRMENLQVIGMLQRDGIFALGTYVDNENFYGFFLL